MKATTFAKPIPWLLAVAGVVALVWWVRAAEQLAPVALRVPGADKIGLATLPVQKTDLRGELIISGGSAPDLPGAWPCFRGSNRDGINTETIPLLKKWPQDGPPKLWTVPMGEGYAAAAIWNGRVFVLDYDSKAEADVLRCLSLVDGKEIWRRSYHVEVKRNHGMSRTVPAVTEKYVVALGPKCHVICTDPLTGEFRWGMDLVVEYGTKVPPWYAGQCPLIDGERAILAPGGRALMIAVDCATGQVLWETPNQMNWDMTHVSIAPMTFAGQKMYLYCGSGGIAGVSAEDGKILWQTAQWKVSMATVPTPVVLEDGRIFLTGGYGAGSMMLQLRDSGGKITPEVLYRLKPEVFGSEQQTPIYYQGSIYGVIPGGQLVCLHPDGRVLWTSGSQRFGIGPYLIADGRIYLVNDTAILSVVEANPAEFRLLAQSAILEHGHESWGPLALVGGRLIVRDMKRMVCLDIRVTSDE